MTSSLGDKNVFQSLVTWIDNGGGVVHPSLQLQGNGTTRGVFATRAIAKGDLLIRLPAQLVLCGKFMPERYAIDNQNKAASPWLRCLAVLYQAINNASDKEKTQQTNGTIDFSAYLHTLPLEYDTLINWSDEQVSSFLAGTALGHNLQADRREGVMHSRYSSAVRPYLKETRVLSEANDFNYFLRACMCLSTRGFHLKSDSSKSSSEVVDACKDGPFLLPMIDLLNHDVQRKCTTVQRDPSDQSFYMVAERDIAAGEELYHSYGDNLTSSQLLQTFGFVPRHCAMVAAGKSVKLGENVTPAIINKSNIISACHAVASSGYANKLCLYMESKQMPDETWDVPEQKEMEERNVSSLISENIVILPTSPLSDELVTMCCLLLMPCHVYNEFMSNEPALLDKTVLEDYYLGKMVCRALLFVTTNKLAQYRAIDMNIDSTNGISKELNDQDLLSNLLKKQELKGSEQRALYGVTIRLEEKACVQALRAEVLEIMDSLDDDMEDGEESIVNETTPSEPKKMRFG